MIDNEEYRFGSAAFTDQQDIKKTGMFTQHPHYLLVGFYGKRPLWYSNMGGLLLTAGARSGKLRDILGYNVCAGICASTMLILDMKGELAAISQDQTPDRKFCIYWNPQALHGLPQHRINPVDYIHIDSSSLVSDVKVFCENIIPLSGSVNGAYFERRAQEFAEAFALTLVKIKGVLTLPDLYRAINLIQGGGDEYLNLAYEMSKSKFPINLLLTLLNVQCIGTRNHF